MPVGDLGNLELGEMLFVFKVVGSMVETRRLSLQPSAGPSRFASIINEVSVGQSWLRMGHDRAASDSFFSTASHLHARFPVLRDSARDEGF